MFSGQRQPDPCDRVLEHVEDAALREEIFQHPTREFYGRGRTMALMAASRLRSEKRNSDRMDDGDKFRGQAVCGIMDTKRLRRRHSAPAVMKAAGALFI